MSIVHCVWSTSGSDEQFCIDLEAALASVADENLESLIVVYDGPSSGGDGTSILPDAAGPWLSVLHDALTTKTKTLKHVAFDVPWKPRYREDDGLTEFVFRSSGSATEPLHRIMKTLEDLANGGAVEVTMCGEFRRSMLFVTLEDVPQLRSDEPQRPFLKTFESLSEAEKKATGDAVVGVADQKWTTFENASKTPTMYEIRVPIPIPATELEVTVDGEGKSVKIVNAPYDWRDPSAIPKVFTSTTFFVPEDALVSTIRVSSSAKELVISMDRRPTAPSANVATVPIVVPIVPQHVVHTWIGYATEIVERIRDRVMTWWKGI